MRRRSITVAGDEHAGETISFRIQGIPFSHTFRADRTVAENLADMHAALAPRLSRPYSVGILGTTLLFSSEWAGYDVDLRELEATGRLTVTEDEPAEAAIE